MQQFVLYIVCIIYDVLPATMVKYNLSDDLREQEKQNESKEAYLNEVHDQKILKAIFKDKKLNKLWSKAEASGFTGMETLLPRYSSLSDWKYCV